MQVTAYVEIVHRSVQLNPPIKDVKFLQYKQTTTKQ